MKKKILSHTGFMIVLTAILTFIAASFLMYEKFDDVMKRTVRDETEYVKAGMEKAGEDYLSKSVGDNTGTRITLTDEKGKVLYDSEADASKLPNHSNRPEFVQAMEEGHGEVVRYSETLAQQNFYYAVKLEDGKILRLAKTTDSVFHTLMSSLIWLGLLMIVIILIEIILVQRQTKKLIKPINNLDLEHPLDNVCYEELKPLLTRVDQQNLQIACQLEELKKTEAVRREFSANVSHELKTPLTSISGYAEIMMNGLVRPEDIPRFSETIYKEARRLLTLIEDIIKISKLDDESVELEKEDVDLFELTREIVSRLSLTAAQRNIHMELTGESVKIHGIRQILDEMIYNITENAVKYNKENGNVTIWVGNTLEGPKVRVSDTGIGIPKEHQDRIFERFYRVDKSHSKERGGTGLGLSIVKHGAILHGAKVQVDSEYGKGTRMEIIFPEK